MANRIANPIYDSVFNRLAYAAANPDVRHMMDVEDEILGELEDLDTTIARQKEQLQQKDEELSQQKEQLSQKDEEIRRLKELLAGKL